MHCPQRDMTLIWNVNFFQHILMIDISSISSEIIFRWIPQAFTDEKSTLIQVMNWCCQATRHHTNKCHLSSMSPYGITKGQWVDMHSYNVFYIMVIQCALCVHCEKFHFIENIYNRYPHSSPTRVRYVMSFVRSNLPPILGIVTLYVYKMPC